MNEIKVSLDIPITQEIEWYIKAKLPDLLNEAIFENKELLDNIIKDVIKSQTRSVVVELLQSQEYITHIQNKVFEQLCVRKGDNEKYEEEFGRRL